MQLLAVIILLGCSLSFCIGRTVEVDSYGRQQEVQETRTVTFINQRKSGACGLYWSGERVGSGPGLFYGPLAPNGGSREIEGFPGQVFVLVEAGTYDRLAEFTISEDQEQQFRVTDAHVPELLPTTTKTRETATECRSYSSSCEECMQVAGCGWSVVREGCFLAHPIATTSDKQECTDLGLPDPGSKSLDAWLNQANALVSAERDDLPFSLRTAYRILQHASLASQEANDLGRKKITVALTELTAKLDAVLDEQDAMELLEKSRHEELAKIHPHMPMVDRRTLAEAQAYIAQGKPVIITDAFAHANSRTSPVAHKWTLEYLRRRIFASNADPKPKFNVAADQQGRCCRYFESQGKAKQSGYPYPFAPSTHLYRDTFDGFVKTVRKAARLDSKKARVIHYLHEIVMDSHGKAVVAGGTAPPPLVADLQAVKATLEPIASDQPFFGGFANAKLWMGQRGIVMPMHYDSTDNLYVMAWGRKRAIIGPPGQLDALYRYPNAHPLVGSSQVNLSSADLEKYPNFQHAQLQEVIVGPGDILYLPAWWWHQFEQPFEDTAALNLWSRDRDQAPDPALRDKRVREHALFDQLEGALVQLFGNQTGLVLDARANNRKDHKQQFMSANRALILAAESWQKQAFRMPGGHPKAEVPASQLVAEFLETQKEVMRDTLPEWQPGTGWDLSQAAKLPRDLRERCEPAPETSPFMSYCG
uniref:JmjC domain-containing protein n=1 Tax=Eutreptiella gymnastica TaxID=73025 RepID=A0A7S4LKH8_9EUGL